PRSVQFLLIETGERVITGVTRQGEGEVGIYPNPGARNFFVRFQPNRFENLRLTTAQGAVVYADGLSPDADALELSLVLAPGLYFVELDGPGITCQRKLIVR